MDTLKITSTNGIIQKIIDRLQIIDGHYAISTENMRVFQKISKVWGTKFFEHIYLRRIVNGTTPR